jgi:hypothetical protein
MKKLIYISKFLYILFITLSCSPIKEDYLKPNIIIIQPIVIQSDIGDEPAKMNLSEELVNKAYSKANIDFHYLEPLYYDNTEARDGEINLDSIVKLSKRDNVLKGQNDIINMFFVNAIDGHQGPTGRGMMNGNIVFIALGDENNTNIEKQTSMEAFVIAHEVGHNLGLKHVVDDDNIIDSLPNIQGDGEFKDRIDPKNSLNSYQINEIFKSPLVHSRIDFLDKEQASIAILDESFEPYFSKLQRKEISTFVQEKAPRNIDSARAFARMKFSSAVMEFSSREKHILSFVVKKTNRWLLENEINLMANQPWRFIKIQNWLCGGFAHTRGTYIILSQSYLDRLSADWSENMSDKSELKLVTSLGGLLVHEQMHSLQRTFKSRFDKLYSENWNFIKQQIKDDQEIIKDQVSNPDAPIAEWLIPDPEIKDKFYWIRTLITKNTEIPEMGKDFVDIAFEITKKNERYFLAKSNNSINSKPLSELDFYTNSFSVKRGLDHPNEISAYMFSDFFKKNYSLNSQYVVKATSTDNNYELFLNWIKKEMK